MNIIQIAGIMDSSLTFGDLPDSNRIVNEINGVLGDEDLYLTTTNTGSDFMEVYRDLKPAKQNQMAGILDEKLRLAILTDIVLWENTERRRENDTYQQTIKLTLVIVMFIVGMVVYSGYNYHLTAVKEMGGAYQSNLLSTLDSAYNLAEKTVKDEVGR